MSFMQTLFGAKPAGNQEAQQQGNQHAANNPTVPNGNNTPSQTASSEPPNGQSPQDQFKDLWSTIPAQQGSQAPNFQLSQEQLSSVTGKMDFTRGINPEQFNKIAAGGQEAVQAFQEVINHVGRQAFQASAQFSSNLTERGYEVAQKQVSNSLPSLVTNHLAKDSLYQANPKLRDPAIQPMVEALQMQLQTKNPNATPQEINTAVQSYMERMQQAMAPAATPNQQTTGEVREDFSSFL